MSRVGRKPVSIPKEAKVTIADTVVSVEGPRGVLTHTIPPGIKAELVDNAIVLTRSGDARQQRALHGLTRALLANMVTGVTAGFKKELEVLGVGYRAEKKGTTLSMALGFSHPVAFEEPPGIQIQVDKQTIRVEGIDKCLVGQTAAKIRSFRKPDVYKGKGIRYLGEAVRKKVGKTGAK